MSEQAATYGSLRTPASDSLTVATVNVNGIRAAAKVRNENNHGILPWLEDTPADVVLLQEVRADQDQAHKALGPALDAGWHLELAPAAAKGRAGVGILSRRELSDVRVGFSEKGHAGAEEFDDAGRFLSAAVDTSFGPVRVASLYLPSGSVGSEKQDEKYRFLDSFSEYLHDYATEAESGTELEMVVGGDWNICHSRADLKNWRGNRAKSGFLPDERAFLDNLVGTFPHAATQIGDELDFGAKGNPGGVPGHFFGAVDYQPSEAATKRLHDGAAQYPKWFDVHRRICPEESGPYSWWTWRGQAFNNDAGWRIDLQLATSELAQRGISAANAAVDKAATVEERWSDHSPVLIEYAAS
ncbi:exodeoxyribonuclease III [Corynebacterium sp. 320]|uniref:exodeoxyribonuclease III n=1 Tax=Corynebacterium TaxID=1716 RepID=UPI00125CC260|nr:MULTISPECIES: exodeoxyribonuclease III [Corynebacterium]KAB1504217.1 exodeoxyribonuclease III [Corynebacterium sp. 320]KAB1552683.1 exodeoxyribonuclease III [Corynebacterium sp. 321]KAB1554099.1 exodeoxyribonuclease III [Corynebacterium sp. 319]KAB3528353.1 exodeoxyribonuclease III [Corynebacterium sp. 250]KAB3540157.1 exodeoxyribonuclease III [Corynebacterium sp. 366]